jgi:hypothetical protein
MEQNYDIGDSVLLRPLYCCIFMGIFANIGMYVNIFMYWLVLVNFWLTLFHVTIYLFMWTYFYCQRILYLLSSF